MAKIQTDVQLLESTDKLSKYAEVLYEIVNKVVADPLYRQTNTQENIDALINDSLLFVRDNSVLTSPANISTNARFSSIQYNDLMLGVKIDLEASFLRLRTVLGILNNTANLINSRTFNNLNKIDMLLDRLANLRTLKTTNDEFDNVISNTFIRDDNDFNDNDFKTMHHEAGGLITLKDTFSDKIVEREENYDIFFEPLHRNAIKREYFKGTTYNRMTEAMDISLYSYNQLYVKNYSVGQDADTLDPIKLTYNGAAMSTIIRLPAIKFVNNISFKFNSAGLTDILDVYYTEDLASSVESSLWKKINYTIDKNNIRGTTINFSTIEAGAIMIVIGQRSSTTHSTIKQEGLTFLRDGFVYNLKRFIEDAQEKLNTVNNKDKIKEYAKPSVIDTLSKETKDIINLIVDQLEAMLPNERPNLPSSAAKDTDVSDILEYNFSIYDLSVNYIHFYAGSIYKSMEVGGKGNISDVIISATGNIPTGTAISHYIELANGQFKILPSGETTTSDIITVTNSNTKKYTSDLLIDTTQSVTVLINNTEIDPLEFSVSVPYPTSNVGTGIELDSAYNLNFGDSIEIQYTVSSVQTNNDSYNGNIINIEESFGNPVLIDQKLSKGKINTILIDTSPEYTSYRIPDEATMKYLPVSGTLSGDPVEPIFGFEIPSDQIKNDLGDLPPYVDTTIGVGISGEYTAYSSKRIYYGVIDESIPGDGNTTFDTTEEYVPGSLHVALSGVLIPAEEYQIDTVGTKYDKKGFTTTAIGAIDGNMLVSYLPVNKNSTRQTSNIADKNTSQLFQGSTEDATIQLTFHTHIDKHILRTTLDALPEWSYSFGKFINRYNESIVYEPIVIRIGGREIVNRTSYLDNETPILNEFTGNNYEYYVNGRTVHFNTIIDVPIDVRYYSINDNMRYVAKLYRVERKVDDITPELYGYNLFINETE